MRRRPMAFLGSPQWIQTSLHLVRCNSSLNLSHCREVRPSFESGSLGVHSTWDRKHRVPLTYLLLREISTWGTGGKLAQIFNQRQGISSLLGMIWGAWSFPQVAVLILIFISTWDGFWRNLCRFLKEVKPLVLYAVEHGIAMEQMRGKWSSSFVNSSKLSYFAFLSWHQSSSRLVTVSLGLSGVLSRKSRILSCLIGNTILLCTKCRDIKPHLPAWGMCHLMSRVAAGTWGIFSSWSGDGHSKFHFVQRSQESCLVMTDTEKSKLGLKG